MAETRQNKIDIMQFGGKLPLLHPALLPTHISQTAENCDLRSGTLKSLKAPLQSTLLTGTPRTIHKLNDTYISFDDDVSIVNSLIAETNHRYYYTGDGYPKKSDSSIYPAVRYMGVTPPAAAPVISINGSGNGETQDVVAYVYTVVTTWGEESAPSPTTAVIEIEGNQTVTLSSLAQPATCPDGEFFRIYRLSASSSGTAEYLFLEEIAIASTSYSDDDNSDALKECESDAIATENWDMPPTDLKGLIQAHNGMVVGYKDKQLFVSEPFIPYAFPSEFALAFDTDITGIGYYDQTIIVVTKTQVYRVTGSDPETLYADTTGFKQTCVSPKGFAATPNGVCFPSNEGLCFSDGSTVQVLTKDWLSPEQWQAYSPEDLVATYYNGKYFGIIKDTATGFTMNVETGELIDFDLSGTVTKIWDLYHDPEENEVALLCYNGSSDYRVYIFEDAATDISYTWKSKQFNDQIYYNRCKITGETGTVTFKFYLDEVLVQTKTATINETFRLPAKGYHAIKEFQVEGTKDIQRIQLATDPMEIV